MQENIFLNAHILIVDDNEADIFLLESILEENGYRQFQSLSDSRRVLAALAEFKPDLILLDLRMQFIDGFGVMKQLQSVVPADSYLPILVITADETFEARSRALSSGAKDFLTKPINAGEAMLRVKNLLETRFFYLRLQNQNHILEEKMRERTAELAESETKHRTLIEQLPAITYIVDSAARTGEILFVSRQVEDLLGIKPEEWMKGGFELWIQSIHPDDRERVVADYLRHYHSSSSFVCEYRLVARHGQVVWLHDTASVLMDEFGHPSRIHGVMLNITDRKKSEQVLQQKAHELEMLYETSLEINSQTSLDALLSSIVRRASSLLNASGGGLYLLEPDGQSLRLIVGHNLPPQYIGIILKPGDGLSGRVAQSGKPMIVEDYQTWPGQAKGFDATSFHRVLGVPLKIKDRVIGVLNVSDSTLTGSFSDGEVRLVTLFADQAALAIDSARLHEQERTRNRELATLYEAAMAISSNLSLEVVLKTVVEQATRAIITDGCALSSWDKERDTITTMVDYRIESPYEIDPPGKTYSLKDFPATRRVFETRQPLLLSRRDPQADPAELALMKKQGIGTMLLLPLVARDRAIGLMELYVDENKQHTFTSDEIRLAQSLSVQTAICIDNARLFEHSERLLRRTGALHRIDVEIASNMDVESIFNVILEQVIPQLGADAADILLYDPTKELLTFAAGRGFRTDALQHTRLRLGEGYAGPAALGRITVHITGLQVQKTDFLRSHSFAQEGFVSYFGVPLIAKGEIKGVLEVFHRTPFDAEVDWINFLETLARQTAIAIDNSTLFKGMRLSNIELGLAYDATIEGWSRAMDLKDNETQNHTRRVTEITEQVARRMGITGINLMHIHRGALLHDIGKIGVPDSILLKPAKLTDDEWVLMKKHPQFAFDLLSPISYLNPAMDIPYCHHEKWDGTGYPRGLKGEQIPLAARIFAVVDVYDALTSDRPYRSAWQKESVIKYIRELSGSHFDPGVIEDVLATIAIVLNK